MILIWTIQHKLRSHRRGNQKARERFFRRRPRQLPPIPASPPSRVTRHQSVVDHDCKDLDAYLEQEGNSECSTEKCNVGADPLRQAMQGHPVESPTQSTQGQSGADHEYENLDD